MNKYFKFSSIAYLLSTANAGAMALNVENNVASNVIYPTGTGNLISSRQLENHRRYMQSYSYDGHYDPAKHTHEQNVQAL